MPDVIQDISKVTLPDGTTYNIKDTEARSTMPMIAVAQTPNDTTFTLYITSPIVNGDEVGY